MHRALFSAFDSQISTGNMAHVPVALLTGGATSSVVGSKVAGDASLVVFLKPPNYSGIANGETFYMYSFQSLMFGRVKLEGHMVYNQTDASSGSVGIEINLKFFESGTTGFNTALVAVAMALSPGQGNVETLSFQVVIDTRHFASAPIIIEAFELRNINSINPNVTDIDILVTEIDGNNGRAAGSVVHRLEGYDPSTQVDIKTRTHTSLRREIDSEWVSSDKPKHILPISEVLKFQNEIVERSNHFIGSDLTGPSASFGSFIKSVGRGLKKGYHFADKLGLVDPIKAAIRSRIL